MPGGKSEQHSRCDYVGDHERQVPRVNGAMKLNLLCFAFALSFLLFVIYKKKKKPKGNQIQSGTYSMGAQIPTPCLPGN